MTIPQQPQPPIIPGQLPPTAPTGLITIPPIRRIHPASIVLAAVGAVMFFCGAGLAVASAGKSAKTAAVPDASTVTIYTTAPAAVAPTTTAAPPTSTAPPAPVVPTITDGIWTVGADFPAGTYRTTGTVDSTCYWAISTSGTNGSDILANDIPGGGRPTVTLQAGQDFQTSRCGTWAKTG